MKRPSSRSLRSAATFETFVLDQLSDLGEVTPKKMFGGVGLYCGGVFFGIIAHDRLYLKVDDTTRAAYEREGMRPFKPYRDRPITMQYYAVPIGVLESGAELGRWAKRAVAVGASGDASKSRSRRSRSSSSEDD